MEANRFLAATVCLCIVLAGCAGGQKAESTPSSSLVAAAPAVHDADTGSIRGVLTDDELVPIPGAMVGVLPERNETTTDLTGAFTFSGLSPGPRTLLFSALGYQDASIKVDVVAGETTETKATLVPIPIEEPRIEIATHAIVIRAAVLSVQTVMTICDPPSTDFCSWASQPFPRAGHLVVEVVGRHAVGNPVGDQLIFGTYLNAQFSNSVFNKCLNYEPFIAFECKVPMRWEANATDLEAKAMKDDKNVLYYSAACDPFWFCVEERYDTWQSLFFHYDESLIPSDYSARPT